jgi:hypothetical protein
MKHSLRLPMVTLLALIGVVSLSGCAALGTLASAVTPTASKLIDAAITIAVTAEILKDPALSHEKAVAFKAIATQVLAGSSNPTATLAQLENTLNSKLVALAPNPMIAASVIAVIGGLQGALNIQMAQTAGAVLTPSTLVAISGIAQQVITTCNFYGA